MGIIVLMAIGFVIYQAMKESPVSTTTRRTGWDGSRHTTTTYHDTGKQVHRVTRTNIWGNKTTDTYVRRPRTPRQREGDAKRRK